MSFILSSSHYIRHTLCGAVNPLKPIFSDMASNLLKPAAKMQDMTRRDKRGYSQSDDTALVRQIRETHAPGRSHIVDVKPILHVIDEIFHRSSVGTDGSILLVIILSCPNI